MLAAAGMSLLTGYLNCQNKEIYVYVLSYVYTHISHIHICFPLWSYLYEF